MLGVPMPPTEFFTLVIDTLAERYGWSYTEISANMYWEEVYTLYEYAANLNTIEKNEKLKFEFLLHANSKDSLNKWNDLPLPYPKEGWKPPKRKEFLPQNIENMKQSTKMTPERRERAEYIKQKLREGKKRARADKLKYYSGN